MIFRASNNRHLLYPFRQHHVLLHVLIVQRFGRIGNIPDYTPTANLALILVFRLVSVAGDGAGDYHVHIVEVRYCPVVAENLGDDLHTCPYLIAASVFIWLKRKV